MENNPVVWFEIPVLDMDRARKFYEAVFQFQMEPMDFQDFEMLAFPMAMDKSGAGGTLVRRDGFTPGNGVLIYFHTPDCAVEEARAAEAGGEVLTPKMSIGQYGFCSVIKDSEGNSIGVHSMQ